MEKPLTRGLPAMHPGEFLKTVTLPALAEAGTPRTRVAELLGLARQSLYDLLEGRKQVDAELALKLGKMCGNSPEFWLNLQRTWDLERARERLGNDLDAIPTLQAPVAA
jgi:addiction module HigA family antidote